MWATGKVLAGVRLSRCGQNPATAVAHRTVQFKNWTSCILELPSRLTLNYFFLKIAATDIVDEAISLFRANVLFRNFPVRSPADRLLVYLTLYINMALRRLAGCSSEAEAIKMLINLGLEDFPLPGDPAFPLSGLLPPPADDKEAGGRGVGMRDGEAGGGAVEAEEGGGPHCLTGCLHVCLPACLVVCECVCVHVCVAFPQLRSAVTSSVCVRLPVVAFFNSSSLRRPPRRVALHPPRAPRLPMLLPLPLLLAMALRQTSCGSHSPTGSSWMWLCPCEGRAGQGRAAAWQLSSAVQCFQKK